MNTPTLIRRGLDKAHSKKIDKYIEIVGSSNPRLNAMAKDSRISIQAALKKRYTNVSITIVDTMEDLEKLALKKPDLVVLGVKLVLLDPAKGYEDSPKMWLSAYLNERNINHTGSGTSALNLEFSKPEAKQRVIDSGLQSSAYFISTLVQPTFKHNLKFPLFVKPTNRGDSKGIDEKSVVYTDTELRAKIVSIHTDCGSDALIEEFLPGREFSVAVIKQQFSTELLAMPIEITSPADSKGNSFLSSNVKKANSEKAIVIDNQELKNKVSSLAIGVFKALGSRDYGRIDIRLDEHGLPSFIEANLMPGLSTHGYLSRCFYMNEAINYEDMINSIIELGLTRSAQSMSISVLDTLVDNLHEVIDPDFAPELMIS